MTNLIANKLKTNEQVDGSQGSSSNSLNSSSNNFQNSDVAIALKVLLILIILALVSCFFVVVKAGERGVLMQFGAVQQQVLNEGIHPIVPLVNTVKKMSVRVQNQTISTEAASGDLQTVYVDMDLNWHLIPETINFVYQEIGNQQAVIDRIITPAMTEVLKNAIATHTAEEVITKRGEIITELTQNLIDRLEPYHIAVNDIALTQVHFSPEFSKAVEAKQVAAQRAKKADYITQKAIKKAEAMVYLAKGKAEAQRILSETLTPQVMQQQAIAKWNGKLPKVMGSNRNQLFDLKQLIPTF